MAFPIDITNLAVNSTTIVVAVMSLFVIGFYRKIRKLKNQLYHMEVSQEMQELKNSATPRNRQTANARPLVMAAIQETKTELTEPIVRKRFRDPKEQHHVSAS